MVDRMQLDIESPLNGWATVRLTATGVSLVFAASYTPWDSIDQLARAAAGLLAGLPEQVVTWNTEPTEYEFRFAVADGRTLLEVYQYPNARRQLRDVADSVAVIEGDTVGIARAVWRGLRRLQGSVSPEAFAGAWGHRFPADTVERVGTQLRGLPGGARRTREGVAGVSD